MAAGKISRGYQMEEKVYADRVKGKDFFGKTGLVS